MPESRVHPDFTDRLDFIGDIHGYAEALVRLLTALGYRSGDGRTFSHPDRHLVFLGDYLDRGPEIPRTVDIVRSTVAAGHATAIMGNHEFNAIAWHTAHPKTGRPLRAHHDGHRMQYAATLEQYAALEDGPSQLRSMILWARTLPMWIDTPMFRAVHATWDPGRIDTIANERGTPTAPIDADFLLRAFDREHPLWMAIEVVVKGREHRMPESVGAQSTLRNPARPVRVRWFDDPAGHTWQSYAMQDAHRLPAIELTEHVQTSALPYPDDAPPVFFGHYRLLDTEPSLFRPNVACVDYGAAREHLLCAYRWNGEQTLDSDQFVSIPVSTAVT